VSIVEDSVEGGGGRVWPIRPEEHVRREVPDGEPSRHPSFAGQLEDSFPRMAVADLPGARVMNPHRVVVNGSGAMIEELSTYWGTLNWRQHPMYLHPFPDPPQEVPGRLAVLAGRGDHSYYHFLIDILPRLAALEAPGVPEPDRWYAPLQHGFQSQILELAGFLPGREVIDADLVPHVRAESLLTPTFPDNHLRTPPWSVEFIRERLRDPALELVPGRRIYVTRGTARNSRTVTNEIELREMLGDRGFSVVDPGALPVADQIRAFAEAEWIVSPHGAGLTNLAFASPGASVIEMFPPDYVQTCYWKLAWCIPGLTYRYLVGVGDPPRNGMMNGAGSDITVDTGVLSRMLDALPAGLSSATA
jgi:capsular polysaccharide biosynthesis protein